MVALEPAGMRPVDIRDKLPAGIYDNSVIRTLLPSSDHSLPRLTGRFSVARRKERRRGSRARPPRRLTDGSTSSWFPWRKLARSESRSR